MDTFDAAARKAAIEVANLVISKQKDYGPENIINCPVGAETGITVRLYDKLARLANLTKTGKTPKNETLKDTADDIIGYGLVLKMLLEGNFLLPLEEDKNEITRTSQ